MNHKEELEWRKSDKARLTNRLSRASTNKKFNQILKVINNHTEEIIKLNRIIKDGKAW